MTEESLDRIDPRQIPIPEPKTLSGWKEIPIVENHEKLVPLGPFSPYWDIFTDSIYMGERQSSPYQEGENSGSLLTQFVREGVAGGLRVTQRSLPENMHLVVFDTFRPIAVQRSFYESFLTSLRQKHPEYTEEELSAHAQRFVSIPSEDPNRPSPHNTGGSVDLAILQLTPEATVKLKEIDEQINPASNDWQTQYALEMERMRILAQEGTLLDFGTAYDFGGEESALTYFEKLSKERPLTADERHALESRRILYHAMVAGGFQPYPDEWWHFNSPKSQMGAKVADLPTAGYGVAEHMIDSEYERMRVMHRKGSLMIHEGTHPGAPAGLEEHMKAAVSAVDRVGDLRRTSIPKAEAMRAED